MNEELERLATTLEESGHYRVLRRFVPTESRFEGNGVSLQRAVFLDVETTGMDLGRDEVIELAMVPFDYAPDGRVFRMGKPFTGLRDPGRRLPRVITELTGLTDADLAGQVIDQDEVAAFLEGVDLIVAHNAAFDRPFFEKTFPGISPRRWACSVREVAWERFGVEGRKLEYLAYRCGVFFDGHRATVDCQVGVHVLGHSWKEEGRTALADLLESADRVDARIWATGSPFESKDLLKARGYRWDANRRVWYRDLPEGELVGEQEWLARNVYAEQLARGRPVKLGLNLISARERYRRIEGPASQLDLAAV